MRRRNLLKSAGFVGYTMMAGCVSSTESNRRDSTVYDNEMPITDILQNRPRYGEVTTPRAIVTVDDPGCPACATFYEETYPTIHNKAIKTGKIRQYSMIVDWATEWSTTAAQYCEGVYERSGDNNQGAEKYQEMKKFYFDRNSISESNIHDVTHEFLTQEFDDHDHINANSLVESVKDGEYRENVKKSLSLVRGSEIRSTPTVLVFEGSELVTEIVGAESYEVFQPFVETY